jgi:hypothetical protein
MKSLFCALMLLCIPLSGLFAQSVFNLDYALDKWTVSSSPGSSGTINYVDAPHSVTLNGSDGEMMTNADIELTIKIVTPGIYSFNWQYFTNDIAGSPRYDIAGILLNGSFLQLSHNNGPAYQTGTYVSAYLTPGTIIGFRVRAMDNLFGNAIFNVSNFSAPLLLLPVNLSYFNGKRLNEDVELQWGTSMESGEGVFEIEKSDDGKKFKPFTKKPWQGNTNIEQHYHTIDPSPYPGLNYYRIKQLDANGSVHYSKVLKVNMDNNSVFKVSPNPATNRIRLQWGAGKKDKLAYSIFDNSGRLISNNNIAFNSSQYSEEIDVTNIPPGVYFIRLEATSTVLRFIKQ